MAAVPFRPELAPAGVREDVLARLGRARLGPEPPRDAASSEWAMGTSHDALLHLVDHWKNRFDWDKAQQKLDQFSHFKAQVQDLDVHFIHERGQGDRPVPLLLIHGWPGSVAEFLDFIPRLTAPPKNGDRSEVFDVVAPSLPGYGWSQAPKEEGWSAERVADLLHELMLQLGYDKYVVQGGDWGGIIARCIGIQHPEHCIGLHANFCVATPPPPKSPRALYTTARYLATFLLARLVLSKKDADKCAHNTHVIRNETAYQSIQATKPSTLGIALNDSIVGLTSWILEKFHGWTDNDGDPFMAVSEDAIITNILIYWSTQSIATSFLLYRESLARVSGKKLAIGSGYCAIPSAMAIFPKDLFVMPRALGRLAFNLAQWTEYPSGGHFAALERPEELEADVRRFFFKTRPFASLLEEASKGDRPTGPAMDVVDQVMAVLGLALLLKLVFVLLALVQ